MADQGSHLGLTGMLLLLMVAWLATVDAESYQKFLRQHVDYPMTQVPEAQYYCNLMMKRRNLATSGHCKHLNTFLHADTASIQAVCGQAGDPTTGDLRESHASFPLTICRLQKGSWAPDCRYQGISGLERIIIACEEGYPVHLQTEVPGY
uniref:Ribonuclease n=1 Tax=Pogona vitticeps TaxID=103695 RepID=A0A6J0VCM4_9SAUR